jgi:NADPH:quinone reductase-like Zn-dependent oxidoreductase
MTVASANAIAIAGPDEKLSKACGDRIATIDHGRDHVTAAALDPTAGHGVDVVVEHVGRAQFGACLGALRKNGGFVTCGGHAGEVADLAIAPFFLAATSRRPGGAGRCGPVESMSAG